MAHNQQLGIRGEQLARTYLEQKGYLLLARNYRIGRKELDLIMQDGDTIVFIEVKTRVGSEFGTPAEAVTVLKQKNLLAAAQGYLDQNQLQEYPVRFDVVAIDLQQKTIQHIKNAFGSGSEYII